jgi:hypothetical protein
VALLLLKLIEPWRVTRVPAKGDPYISSQEDVMKILGFSALALAALAATVGHADAACFYHYATDGYGNLYLVWRCFY